MSRIDISTRIFLTTCICYFPIRSYAKLSGGDGHLGFFYQHNLHKNVKGGHTRNIPHLV